MLWTAEGDDPLISSTQAKTWTKLVTCRLTKVGLKSAPAPEPAFLSSPPVKVFHTTITAIRASLL